MLSCAPGIACVCLAAFGAYLGGCLLVPTRHGRPTTAPRELRLGPTRGGPGAMDATGSWRMCAPRMGISSSASKSASRFASRRGGLHRSRCESGCGSMAGRGCPQPDGAPTAAKRTVAATQQAGVGLEILGGPTPGPSRSMPEQFPRQHQTLIAKLPEVSRVEVKKLHDAQGPQEKQEKGAATVTIVGWPGFVFVLPTSRLPHLGSTLRPHTH